MKNSLELLTELKRQIDSLSDDYEPKLVSNGPVYYKTIIQDSQDIIDKCSEKIIKVSDNQQQQCLEKLEELNRLLEDFGNPSTLTEERKELLNRIKSVISWLLNNCIQ